MFARKSLSLLALVCVLLADLVAVPGPYPARGEANHPMAAAPSAPGPARLAHTSAAGSDASPVTPDAANRITLTEAGFDPAVLTVPAGTGVGWINTTAQTHILQSGVPFQVYLPLILRRTAGGAPKTASATPPALPIGTAGEGFRATLEPGGVFTHTFTTVGEFPYYLADAPHQRGRVVVTYDLDAPPLDPTVATTVCEATAFLYTGPDPLQTGVEPGTIDCQQVAVLRGRVLDRQNDPLPGVRITVLDRPEYGQTLSRADGLFDLAVNGGARLTVDYRREGYLPAQRPVEVPWNDYAWLDDVVLIPVDAQVTEVDLAQVTEPFSVAQSSVISDTDGIRRETLLIPQGTTAQLVLPGGVTQTLTTMSVHLTEYTVGENGPEAMPAPLPPNVAYTYAFELNADEELAAGAEGVAFSQPVMHYVDNFLDFPAGTIVPLGSYDGDKGVWVPEESGIVLKLVSITGGLADLDIDGDDLADDPAALAAWGITDDERAQLANLYPAGRSLWRVRIGHFSQPWDCNWGARCKNDRCDPPNAPSPGSPMVGDPCQREGSIIGCQNQTVGQALDLVGVPFGLHYDSSRVTGYKHAYTLDIPLSGPSVLDELVRIDLVVWVAGQTFKRSFPDQPNQTTSFQWDGRDVYGRLVQGPQPVTVRVGFVYEMEYVPTDRFGYSGGAIPITGSRARREMTLWKVWHGSIGTWNAGGLNVGGWSLDIYHAYVPTGRTLYLGDGRWRTAETMGPVIDTLAGVGQGGPGCYDDGIPARQACLETVQGLAIAPDGSFYESEYPYRVRRVSADGIITTVAGILGTSGFGGDGCPATQALLNDPRGLALAPDGSLYIADGNNRRVRRVSPDGIITTVVGTGGSSAFNGDGIPATQANLSSPRDLAVGPDGSLYIADSGHLRVRRVDPAGLISTVAGNGQCGPYEDGIPATAAGLCSPYGLDIGPDGSLYLTEVNNKNRIRRVGTDGIISTVAGTGASGFAGDGGPATGALLDIPRDVAVAADGALYIADTHNRRVRFVGQNGVIVTLAGGGNPPWPQNGDGGPAAQAKFGSPQTLDIAPDGSLLVSDQYSGNRVRRVSSPFAGHTGLASLVPSEDGSEVYSFDPTGRHLRTLNALTGATLLEFGYDSAALLATVTDGDGNVTRIEREADGSPTAIVGPYGQRTVLGLDANGYLASVTNPAGEAYQFSYTLDGLLTTETDPRGNEFRYTYDGRGRLAKDEDPAGGSQTLVRTEFDNGYQVAVTTALGRTTTYSVERLSNCDIRQVNTFPNGLSNQALFRPDASQVITFTDGTVVESVEGPDPRWGMLAPVCQIVTTTTPSGLESVVRVSRTAVLTDPADPLSLESLDEVTSLNGREYATHYDAATRTFTFTTPAMRQLIVTTDLRGRLVWGQADGLEPSEFSYDARGRLSSAVAGSGASSRTTTLHYGPDGILSSIVDPLDRAVYLDYDLAGRVTLRTLPGERVIGYTYDANGNLASIAPPDRPPHEFTYSGVNLLTAYIPPDVGGGNARTDYAYNADRQLTRITRPDGQVVDFSYDPAGRLASLTTPDYQTTYAYDTATGNLAIIANSRGVDLTHAYDGVLITGTAWSGSVSGTVTRTYDDDLRPAALAVTGGGSVTYQYDPDSLLTRAGDLALSRNAQNGLLTGTALGSITDAWDYNTFGEPTGYYASYNGASLLAAQYARDALGRVDQKTETIGGSTDAYSYTYDLAGRLSGVQKNGTTVATYTYDGNGNRLTFTDPGGTISGAYDDQDRLLQYGSTTYTYTEGGELSSKTTGGQTTTYHYDALGNLLAVSLPDGTQIEYLIDGANRRVGKKVNGVLVKGFLYEDALRPIAELDGAGNVVSRFGYGTRVNVPDYMVKGGTTYRFILDPLGSPRLVVNVATGQIAQRIDYDGFGSVINDTNPGFQPFGFAGGLYDGHTRLIRFGARDYDSQAGRWTAEDQLRYLEKDTNRYAYLSNDPVNWIDPTGEAQYPGNLPTPPHAPEGYRFRGTIVVENYQLKYSDVPWGEEDKPGAIIQLSAETIVEDFKLKSDRIIAHVFTPIENKDLICDSGYR